MDASPCPTPALSKMIQSYPDCRQISNPSATCLLSAMSLSLVAKDRMYTRGLEMLFIRIRSPSKAPPVFFLEGSTETTATVLSGNSCRKRRTISSVIEDFPAPPVPVMPRTGARDPCNAGAAPCNPAAPSGGLAPAGSLAPFSALVISRATRRTSFNCPSVMGWAYCPFPLSGKSQPFITSSIIPSRPSLRPSSGE